VSEFTDPRLVEIYETLNPYEPGTQPDFYAALAASIDAESVVDIGCGTGLVTRHLAARGHRMTGLDPSAAMLAIARGRPYGSSIRWIHGEVTDLPPLDADLAIMAGHVPQFFLTDAAWASALASIARALRPGGWLSFETRDPTARAWETPSPVTTADDPVHGPITSWSTVTVVQEPLVSYDLHYRFATGEEITTPCTLRYRTRTELAGSLDAAGFTLTQTHGTWTRHPTGPELIVIAQRMPTESR
jgi:SAM-dependent methyltransferase